MRRTANRAGAVLALAMTAVLFLPELAHAQRRGILRGRLSRGPEVRTYYVYPPTVRYVYPSGDVPPSVVYDEEPRAVTREPRLPGSPVTPAADESGAPARPDATSAVFFVLMPAADAELWVGDAKVTGSGPTREYATAPLRAGQRHAFTFTARWREGGRLVEEKRTVEVQPGDRVTVELARPNRPVGPGEIVPREYKEPRP